MLTMGSQFQTWTFQCNKWCISYNRLIILIQLSTLLNNLAMHATTEDVWQTLMIEEWWQLYLMTTSKSNLFKMLQWISVLKKKHYSQRTSKWLKISTRYPFILWSLVHLSTKRSSQKLINCQRKSHQLCLGSIKELMLIKINKKWELFLIIY